MNPILSQIRSFHFPKTLHQPCLMLRDFKSKQARQEPTMDDTAEGDLTQVWVSPWKTAWEAFYKPPRDIKHQLTRSLATALNSSFVDKKGIWWFPGNQLPSDSQGITKYRSNQYVNCSNQWRTDESGKVLCLSEAYEKFFWWFLDLI